MTVLINTMIFVVLALGVLGAAAIISGFERYVDIKALNNKDDKESIAYKRNWWLYR